MLRHPSATMLQVQITHGPHPSSLLCGLVVAMFQNISLSVLISIGCAHGRYPESVLE